MNDIVDTSVAAGANGVGQTVDSKLLKTLSGICFVLGFVSIIGSIAIWFLTGGVDVESRAHGERFGIFVGLWAPTFFILSNRFALSLALKK
jgi:hypothetical protein